MFNRIDKGMYWDRAWKLVEGCTPVSEGCANCWSARETHIRANHPNGKISTRNRGLTLRRSSGQASMFNGTIRLRADNLILPIRTKKPTAWAIWNDLFHEAVPDEFINIAFHAMWETPHHLFFILTKRPHRMLEYMTKPVTADRPKLQTLPNVWLGVTAENQEQADNRIPVLLRTPAARRYVSIEPMLGPIDLTMNSELRTLNWIIVGGESGFGARPMHPDWPRSLRDQCVTAGVPFFFKQRGEWGSPVSVKTGRPGKFAMIQANGITGYLNEYPRAFWSFGSCTLERVGKKAAGRILDGKESLEVPKLW